MLRLLNYTYGDYFNMLIFKSVAKLLGKPVVHYPPDILKNKTIWEGVKSITQNFKYLEPFQTNKTDKQ